MGGIDLSINICGIKLKNPAILASGILGCTSGILRMVAKSGAEALTTKSISVEERHGHRGPILIEPMHGVVLNAFGLPNPGYRKFIEELKELEDINVPVIPSIAGRNYEEFVEVSSAFEDAGSKILEVNISCPHSEKGYGGVPIIAQDTEKTAAIIDAVKESVSIPIIVKLSPNVTDIVEFAKVSVECGADAVSAINTIEALEVDPILERPILGNMIGGQSGPSIRCIAQRKVADIAIAMKRKEIKKVPIIGIGGIRSGEDIARFLLLGAEGVGIGSSILYDDLDTFDKAISGLKDLMREKGYKKISDFRSNALEWMI